MQLEPKNSKNLIKPCPRSQMSNARDVAERLLIELYTRQKRFYGFAANQFGIIERVFVMRYQGENKAFINPYINKHYGTAISKDERSISDMDIMGDVRRYEKVQLQYMNSDTEVIEEWFEGQVGFCVQHLVDQLDGIQAKDKFIRKTTFSQREGIEHIGRNELCKCLSGLKYKKCCGALR